MTEAELDTIEQIAQKDRGIGKSDALTLIREVRQLRAALAEACRRNTLVEPPGPAPPDNFLGGRAEHV